MSDDLRSRLRRLMADRRLSMKELSIAAGLGETAVRDIIERQQDPRTKTLARLAQVLGVTIGELVEGQQPLIQSIPIVGCISAGEGWIPFDDEAAHTVDEVELRVDGGEPVALEVKGDSMYPVYRDGDLLIGAKASGPRADNLVGLDCIVLTDRNERYVKFLARGDAPGKFHLRSYNPAHKDIPNVKLVWAAPILWVKRSQR